jgi:hypothetical protein
MAKKISSSVGKGGKNKPEDIKIVQELLNDFTKMCGFKKLDEDGLIGPKTLSAIAEFQKTAVGMSKPDSRIDPGGDSFSTLSKGPKKAEAEAKKAEEAEKEKQAAAEAKKAKSDKGAEEREKEDSKPQVRGNTRGIDKKILAVLEAVSAHFGKPIVVENGKQTSTSTLSAESLWQDWLSKLDHGKLDPNLKNNPKLRKDLDRLYFDVKQDEFFNLVSKNARNLNSGTSSAHAEGRAIDIKKNTDSKMVAALSTILRYEDEGDVIHFDDTGKSIPRTITADIKKKWK